MYTSTHRDKIICLCITWKTETIKSKKKEPSVELVPVTSFSSSSFFWASASISSSTVSADIKRTTKTSLQNVSDDITTRNQKHTMQSGIEEVKWRAWLRLLIVWVVFFKKIFFPCLKGKNNFLTHKLVTSQVYAWCPQLPDRQWSTK